MNHPAMLGTLLVNDLYSSQFNILTPEGPSSPVSPMPGSMPDRRIGYLDKYLNESKGQYWIGGLLLRPCTVRQSSYFQI